VIVCLPATVADLPRLTALENAAFVTDRIRCRQFRYLLSKTLIVKAVDGEPDSEVLVGCLVLLFRRDSHHARIYSLAVSPVARRRGVARRLLAYAETESRRRGLIGIVLEVRPDNEAAIALYQAAGFRQIGHRLNYYEDGAAAVRLSKIFADESAR
jgi:ribosomal protein S18 acetylase RimI-like enzyme